MRLRSWLLLGFIIFLKTEMAQVAEVNQEITMGLVPVTEIKYNDEWITVLTTVPVDLICGNYFAYIPPGALRIRKNIFPDFNLIIFRDHDFSNTHKITSSNFPNGIEMLSYTVEGIISLGFKEAKIFCLNEKEKFSIKELKKTQLDFK